jgi:Fe-S cluster assembly iron-binding protein IscA
MVIILIIIASLAILLLIITMLADRGKLGSFPWPLLTPRQAWKPASDEGYVRSRIEAAVAHERSQARAAAIARSTTVDRPFEAAPVVEDTAEEPAVSKDIDVDGILTVTARAAGELAAAVKRKTTDPSEGFRIIKSPDNPKQIKMSLDYAGKNDRVVTHEGVLILIVDPEVLLTLKGLKIDFKETPDGSGFSISYSNSK